MRFLDGKSIGLFGLVLALGMSNAGCGDDDSAPSDGGLDGSVDGGGGGTSGGGAGNSSGTGGKGGGMDSGTTTGGTGGRTTGGTGGTTNIPMAMCDTSIPTTATCGGTMCPGASGMGATFTCTVPCCLPDDSCGLRRAYMDDPTDCAAPGVADPSCPEYMGQGPFGGMMLPGMADAGGPDAGDGGANQYTPCCASSGHCGIISSIDMLCITHSLILTDLMPGPACGESNDGGANDAGH
jgi:hypothetical protein